MRKGVEGKEEKAKTERAIAITLSVFAFSLFAENFLLGFDLQSFKKSLY
jgi:hypothetical protein